MKRKIAGLGALVIAASMSVNVLALAKGDANGDGAISSKDITRVGKILMGTKEPEGEETDACDVNSDGKINILDYILEKELVINELGAEVVAGVPEFSKESGFYNDSFDLELTAGVGSKIYYTTDGTNPTTSSQLYSTPIKITNRSSEPNLYASGYDVSSDRYNPPAVTKGTVVKAIAVDKDGNVSDIVSQSYFTGIDINQQYGGFPIVNITIDPDDFFDYEKGIYVKGKIYDEFVKSGKQNPMQSWLDEANYTQRGKEWERKVYFELFENDGKLAHSQYLGARIAGNATRSSIVKSLKFYSRDEYGKKNVKYDLIPGNTMQLDRTTPIEKYNKFRIRNGGNDLGHAQFRDNYIQSLVSDLSFDTQASRPCVMFINGEFFGVYTLQEEYDDAYIENNYNIDKNNVIIIETGKEVGEGEESDLALYEELINFAKNNDLSQASNYQQICNMIDVQNFIEYYCTQIFIANQDWMTNDNNYRTWRSRTTSDQPYEDGKWRWMLYDTEYSTSLYSMGGGTYTEDTLKIAMFGKQMGFGNWQIGGDWQIPGMGDWGVNNGNNNNNNNNGVNNGGNWAGFDMGNWNAGEMALAPGDEGQQGEQQQPGGQQQNPWGQWQQPGQDPQNPGGQNPGGQWNPGGQQPGQQTTQEPQDHTVLFYKLLQNEEFKQRFVNTFCTIMSSNLSESNMLTQLEYFTNMYQPVMQEQQQRIGNSNNFTSEVNNIKTFIQNRHKNVYNFLKTDLELTGETASVDLAVNDAKGGKLLVEGVAVNPNSGKWSGTFFTDYKVTVKAVPAEEYTFSGWTGATGSGDTITVTPGQASGITANFTKK
ncbi:MAG: CotH kinase family protein [Oscillospiraceae bacterium]|nr:CotH kinase family protein [Oscillospiraceae bacterium]